MFILAKSEKGKEFFYNAKSARKVSKASAKTICDALNKIGWNLKENEVWHIHEVDKYDIAYEYGMFQSFTIRNGVIKAKSC